MQHRNYVPHHVDDLLITRHASERMSARSISPEAIDLVLTHGRVAYVRKAEIYALGRKEVAKARTIGLDLRAHEGLHVVCGPTGAVMTVYRNHDLRGLRPRRRRHPRRRQRAAARRRRDS